jgi:hypothetical protein
MRKLTILLALVGLSATFPAAALAGGTGHEACPAKLVQQPLGTGSPNDLTEAPAPITVEHIVLLPVSVKETGKGTSVTYNYVWGEKVEPGGISSFLLCGVNVGTSPSTDGWIGIAILTFLSGFAAATLLYMFPRQRPVSSTRAHGA